MEAINEVNELLTAKLCSPVIILGVVVVISLISIFLFRRSLDRYNTHKMDNLKNLYSMQEVKYLIILIVIMYGLCQYNKTELAWIFLIFPIIYTMIQNALLYIHVSSAVQNAPQEQSFSQGSNYGLGMNAPLLEGEGPSKPILTTPEQKSIPVVSNAVEMGGMSTSMSNSLTGGGGGGLFGNQVGPTGISGMSGW